MARLRLWSALLVVLAAVSIAAALLRDNWVFLWDGYGHHGVFRCGTERSGTETIRTCIAGIDETVFIERRAPDGTRTRSWFAAGVWEYARTIRPTNGDEQWLIRGVCDEWVGHERDGVSPPDGLSPRRCVRPLSRTELLQTATDERRRAALECFAQLDHCAFVARLLITSSGHVSDVMLTSVSGEVAPDDLAQCVKSKVSTWEFPAAELPTTFPITWECKKGP